MNSLTDPRALVTAILIVFGLLWIVRKQDPVELLTEAAYAFRRAVWIAGKMLMDTPAEYAFRWRNERPLDGEALRAMKAKYPAGEGVGE